MLKCKFLQLLGLEIHHSRHASSSLVSVVRRHFQGQVTKTCPEQLPASEFRPKKALILTKLSRYEFEQRRNSDLNEEQLAKKLAERGSDYYSLVRHHNVHKRCEESVTRTLQEHGLETKVVKRFNYNRELVDWADVIITTGGDGTFLLAASRIQDCGKPVIGVNSDPTRSEGYLCLPKKYANDFPDAMHKLLAGKFRWRWRHRLRITVIGEHAYDPPIELHDQQLMYPEYRFMDCLQEQHPAVTVKKTQSSDEKSRNIRVLPVLSLNEVFIGETLSSRVSYYEISIDESDWVKQKSSGVTISTGTGSSSWTFNISKLTPQCVKDLLGIVKSETNVNISDQDPELINRITKKFNSSLLFHPSESMMAYTIRDPVFGASEFTLKPRGFAKSIEIKSRCFDACLVIDGGLSFVFNDGTRAIFEMHDSDALKTVLLDED